MGFQPRVDADGSRRYGHGLSVRGEDVTRCVESVAENTRCPSFYQCRRRRGHGPGGLYCRQHDPDARAARDAADRQARAAEASRQERIVREARRLARALGVKGGADYWAGAFRERLVVSFEDARRLVERIESSEENISHRGGG